MQTNNTINDTSEQINSSIADQVLENIRVVLIQTSHPGNIGSTARAMKTMGLSDLCLVSPKSFPDEQATTMASNADDLLENATVVDSLPQAIADCHVVIGSSARHERSLRWNVFNSRECGEVVGQAAQKGKVALVFGRERTGLTNSELAFCQHLVHIPTNPEYSSLNVASAVQILAYECRMAADLNENIRIKSDDETVTAEDMQGYYDQLELMMVESGFLDPDEPRFLMSRLRRMYARSEVKRSELNILWGMIRSFQKQLKK